MHVDYLIVESTRNAKPVVIQQDVCVHRGTQEILELHVFYVSRQTSYFSIFLFIHCMSRCMTLL